MVVDKLKLRNTQSFVNRVGPFRAAVDLLVTTTIVARVNDQAISRLKGKRMIVRVDGGADLRKFPGSRAAVAHRFPNRNATQVDDVGRRRIYRHVDIVEALLADISSRQIDRGPGSPSICGS